MGDSLSIGRPRLKSGMSIGPQLYAFLRRKIVQNELTPGTRLSENQLARHFEVSRQPVREALLKLSLDRLIEILPQRSTRVLGISVENLKETCFVRCSLESKSLETFSLLDERHREEVVASLRHNIARQREAAAKNRERDFFALDDDFHRTICGISGYGMIADLIESLRANLDRIRFLSQGSQPGLETLIGEHAAVADALAEGDIGKATDILDMHNSGVLIRLDSIITEHPDCFYV